MKEKIEEIKSALVNAESEMNYWSDHTENDNCIYNKYDLHESIVETLKHVVEILER